jgi:probable rRNA maturation factor
LSISLVIQDVRWRKLKGLTSRLKRAVSEALRQGGVDPGTDLTILLTTDARVKKLNHSFRHKDAATNVLSFPADIESYLGDVAIAYGVTVKEARASGKSVPDHAIHLAVHGVLHLLGFDHTTPRKAKIMEPLEVRILKTLKIADPYEVA